MIFMTYRKNKTHIYVFFMTCNFNIGSVLFLRDVNTAIMELLVMAYALKTSCAKNIIGVIPYFPYSKQCKMRKRGSIVCKLLASMLAKAGKSQFQVQFLSLLETSFYLCICTLKELQFNLKPYLIQKTGCCASGVAGLTHIITMDLHQKEIQGFFNFPVDNLRASHFLIQYIQEQVWLQ